MNPDLARLQPYPFERLTALKAIVVPNPDLEPIALSIGEPRHPTPGFIVEALLSHLHGLSNYPTTRGTAELRNAVAAWLTRRFRLPAESIDPERAPRITCGHWLMFSMPPANTVVASPSWISCAPVMID